MLRVLYRRNILFGFTPEFHFDWAKSLFGRIFPYKLIWCCFTPTIEPPAYWCPFRLTWMASLITILRNSKSLNSHSLSMLERINHPHRVLGGHPIRWPTHAMEDSCRWWFLSKTPRRSFETIWYPRGKRKLWVAESFSKPDLIHVDDS